MCLVEVLGSPAEYGAVLSGNPNLSETTCVVFDVLRATSTQLTALRNGAAGIQPVSEISQALESRRQSPNILLAGERHGLRIRAAQTGSVDFDFGNSPREFSPERVAGKSIVMTTTNGTRALNASAQAAEVWIASFGNIRLMAQQLLQNPPKRLLLVCAGTGNQMALEDLLGAGALCERLASLSSALLKANANHWDWDDSAIAARRLYQATQHQILPFVSSEARNGRRLADLPDLAADLPLCLSLDTIPVLGRLCPDGVIRRIDLS